MYKVNLNGNNIDIQTRKHQYAFAIDGSKPNPLEATYAALAGCAGVYTIKACQKLGINTEGIQISGTPYFNKANPLMLEKWVTQIEFPNHFTTEQKALIIEMIDKCAVKELMQNGQTIFFSTIDKTLSPPSAEV